MQGLTKTQMLEENIALLEARIRELENPSEAASSIRLHDPSALNISPDMMLAQPMPGVSGPRYHGLSCLNHWPKPNAHSHSNRSRN